MRPDGLGDDIAARSRRGSRSKPPNWYYQPRGETAENLALMHLLEAQYTRTPVYGVERMTGWSRAQGNAVNPKRVRRLLRLMGLEALCPKRRD